MKTIAALILASTLAALACRSHPAPVDASPTSRVEASRVSTAHVMLLGRLFGENALPSGTDDAAIRFTTMQAFGGTGVLRLQRHNGQWMYVQKATGVNGKDGRITADSVPVPATVADSVIRALRALDFLRNEHACREIGLDGYSLTIETQLDGTRLIKRCWFPSPNFSPQVDQLLKTIQWMAAKAINVDVPRAP